jgi:hypothetical protein
MWFAGTVPSDHQPIEAVSSYARHGGDAVRVVVTLPDTLHELVGDRLTTRRVWLRLSRQVDDGRETTRAPVTVDTTGAQPVLTAEVASELLAPAVWNLALRVGQGGPLVRLEARLLVSDTQPIALLAGPKPLTRMDEPAPR